MEAVWVIPCLEHPFHKDLLPFERRFRMCELAFESFDDNVRVTDIEKKLGGESYTIRTVRHLQKTFPGTDFVLIMGEDAARESAAWQDAGELKKIIPWRVVPRGPRSPIPDVSATKIREHLRKGIFLGSEVPPPVLTYIRSEKLFSITSI